MHGKSDTISGLKEIDDYTLSKLTFCFWRSKLGWISPYVEPKHIYDKIATADSDQVRVNPVGMGHSALNPSLPGSHCLRG